MQIKKYPHKNLNKNRILYFQIGLSLVLVFSLISIEWRIQKKQNQPQMVNVDTDFSDDAFIVKIPEDKPLPPESKIKPKEFKGPILDNDQDFFDKESRPKETTTDPNIVFEGLETPISEIIPDVPSVTVEEFPIFPGCEKFNEREELMSCMNTKLYKFIGKHFNTSLANDLNLEGEQKIYTIFRVNHEGEVILKGVRSSHPKLSDEARRVIEKLPSLVPGKMGEKPVNVIFSLPINFKVND